ncbi:MAG: flavin reductase family protein [Halofilum sp. (in: g-proteobacteria)]
MASHSLASLTNPFVYLISTHHEGRDNALVATWVVSATLVEHKGRVMVALSPSSLTAELVQASRRFAVQLLSEGQHDLVARLGLSSGREADKLDGLERARTNRGLPLVSGTCGWADCDATIATGTDERLVCLGRVVEEEVYPDRRPLTFGMVTQALPEATLRAIEAQRTRDAESDWPNGSTEF